MRRYLLLLIGSVVTIAFDQITKIWAVNALVVPNGDLPEDAHRIRSEVYSVTESWWNFKVAGNKGAAWGLFRDLPEGWRVAFFVLIGLVAIAFIIALYRRARGHQPLSTALTLILGGAIGNLIDRVRLGYVIDFIDWYYAPSNWHWPTFNIADVAISVGVGLLLIDMILHRGERAEKAPAST
ncbi:MAG: signal peptidase II [Myxococcales bacterium]|nr:signal peptidase II [Myxococcales bacterium]